MASGALRSLFSTSTYVHKPGEGQVKTVTLLPGDGIGPELTDCVERVVDVLKAPLIFEKFDSISGANSDGTPVEEVPNDLIESLKRNKVCIKGTLWAKLYEQNTNTQSLNVLLRKELDLYVNLVHCFSIPGVETRHGETPLDITIVRENTEGEYSGLEHVVVPGVVESVSRPGFTPPSFFSF